MKKIILLLLFPFLFNCDNDNDGPLDPLSQLPPATQTGENTFGCLLDGEVFLPDNAPNSYNCFYQLIDGEYYFTVRGSARDGNNNSVSIVIKTQQREILEGNTYDLVEPVAANVFGGYFVNSNLNYTSFSHSGSLLITKLDIINNIVSGNFYFDVLDSNGIIHQIRNGRFDMHFTQ